MHTRRNWLTLAAAIVGISLAGVPRTSRLHSLKDAKDGARLLFT